MKKLKTILGYAWAVAAFIIVLATFFGNDYFSRALARTTGIIVSPLYSGGEIVLVLDHGAYRTSIHRPVFGYLIGQAKEGFVQINWGPANALPSVISEGIDYNGDGREDFSITLNTVTGEVKVSISNPAVISVEKSYHLSNGWAVRVLLKRQI